MKTIFKVGVLSCTLFTASCSLIEREAGYPGGNLGYGSDRKILFAQGHDQRVQRYLVTLSLLAPLISETAATPIEAKLSAERINAIYEKLDILKTAADTCELSRVEKGKTNYLGLDLTNCDIGANGLPANALAFESVSFDVAKSLNNALKQAYDNLNIRKRVSNVTSLAPSEILKTVLRARHLLPVAMKYFATYRDVTAVLSASVLESCVHERTRYIDNFSDETKAKIKEAKSDNEKDEITSKTLAASWRSDDECQGTGDLVTEYLQRSRTVDSDIARNEKPIREIYNASRDAINSGLDWQFTKKHAAALVFHIDRACKKLVKLQEIEVEEGQATDCRRSGTNKAKKLINRY